MMQEGVLSRYLVAGAVPFIRFPALTSADRRTFRARRDLWAGLRRLTHPSIGPFQPFRQLSASGFPAGDLRQWT